MNDVTRLKLLHLGLAPLGTLLQKVVDTPDEDILMTGIIRDSVKGLL